VDAVSAERDVPPVLGPATLDVWVVHLTAAAPTMGFPELPFARFEAGCDPPPASSREAAMAAASASSSSLLLLVGAATAV